MFKIKILKSGKFAIDPAVGGVVLFEKGQELTEDDKLTDIYGKKTNASGELNIMSRKVAQHMEDAKWAKLTDEAPKEKAPELEKDPLPDMEKGSLPDLLDLLKNVKTDKERKSKVQDWAVVNYGIKPSKSMTTENMIIQISDHIANNESGTE